MKNLLSLSTLLLILSGCVSTEEWLKTKPVAFQQGYEIGCDNGEARALNSTIFKKDDTKEYKENTQYRIGFDDGYETCYSDKEVDIMMRRR